MVDTTLKEAHFHVYLQTGVDLEGNGIQNVHWVCVALGIPGQKHPYISSTAFSIRNGRMNRYFNTYTNPAFISTGLVLRQSGMSVTLYVRGMLLILLNIGSAGSHTNWWLHRHVPCLENDLTNVVENPAENGGIEVWFRDFRMDHQVRNRAE